MRTKKIVRTQKRSGEGAKKRRKEKEKESQDRNCGGERVACVGLYTPDSERSPCLETCFSWSCSAARFQACCGWKCARATTSFNYDERPKFIRSIIQTFCIYVYNCLFKVPKRSTTIQHVWLVQIKGTIELNLFSQLLCQLRSIYYLEIKIPRSSLLEI